MLITVSHVTRYTYAEPVNYTVQSLRLTPAQFKGQRIANWQVRVPGCAKSLQFKDGFGNAVDLVTVYAQHRELVIEAGGTVETSDCSGVVAGLAKSIPPRVFLKETEQTRPDSAIRDLAQSVGEKDPLDRVHALAGSVRDRIDYVAGHHRQSHRRRRSTRRRQRRMPGPRARLYLCGPHARHSCALHHGLFAHG